MTTDKHPDDLRLDKEYEQINHPNGVTTWKTKPKEKPEALRLARELEQAYRDDEYFQQHATELRRQFEEIKRLHALNQELLEALRDYRRSDDDRVSVAMGILQEALAEQPAQQQEPLPNKVLADAYQCGFHAGRKSAEILPPECMAGDLDCSHAERLCRELREKNS